MNDLDISLTLIVEEAQGDFDHADDRIEARRTAIAKIKQAYNDAGFVWQNKDYASITCGQCLVTVTGPTIHDVEVVYRGHEKEAHGYMTAQEWIERLSQFMDNDDTLPSEMRHKITEEAKRAAGLTS